MELSGVSGEGDGEMDQAVDHEIERLQQMSVAELQQRYREVFGEPVHSRHKQHLVRRIAWRLQALAEGDLSERARQRALAIANDADLKVQVPAGWVAAPRPTGERRYGPKDRRLPVIGTVLNRSYRGQTVVVKVLKN